jgi:hypothetical protein
MSRQPSHSRKKPARKARPVLEGLEDRQLLSAAGSRAAIHPAHPPIKGLSHHNREFTYRTPTGGLAVITMTGVGNLKGTTAPGGVLQIEYADTNSFSKIIGKVYGGGNRAPLESIYNRHLVEAGAQNSLSGVGGNVIQAVILNDWDLVPGGVINLTSGVNSLVLNSIGPDTQVHLRDIPASIEPTALVANATAVLQNPTNPATSSSSTSSSSSARFGGSSSPSTSGVTPTLPVGVPTPVTNANGTTWTYKLEQAQDLTLVGVSGSFTAQPNVVESLPAGQPRQTPPPAPPGIILKVNGIYGSPTAPINLLTDSEFWGYDATTHRLVQFNLNLTTGPGQPDFIGTPTTKRIQVPGNPSAVGLNLGWDGSQLDVLVSSGATVYAYNATTGLPDTTYGPNNYFFSTSNLIAGPIISIGSTDTVTVIGNGTTLQMINLATSLQMGMAQAIGTPAPAVSNTQEYTALGGLTSIPGSTTVYGAVSAHFNTLQPNNVQLGIQPANTVLVTHAKIQGAKLTYSLSGGTPYAFTSKGSDTNVIAGEPGSAMGSVDSNLAIVFNPPASVDKNVVELVNPTTGSEVAKIRLKDPNDPSKDYPYPIVALSGSFRPDLTGSAATGAGPALIDIQGDVQSFRGRKATGMVFNDTGNLNLVKFGTITNSTIVGQPIGHIDVTQHLVNVTMLTPTRTVSTRGGVTVDPSLHQIGPLSFTGDGASS